MAGLYSYYLPPIVLTPAQVNIPQMVNTGNRLGGWLLVQNNSPYKIQVQLPGSANVLPLDPQTVDKFQVNTGDQVIYILPLTLLPGAAPSSQVDIQVYPGLDTENEPPGTYPMSLTRQAAPTSASAALGFTASFLFNTATNNEVILNVFNPANSGKRMQIYSARSVFGPNAAATNVISVFAYQVGADNNYPTAVTPIPNDTVSTSSMHATATSAGSIVIPTQAWDAAYFNFPTTQGTQYEAVPFDDKKQIPPGVQAIVYIQALPASGGLGEIAIKYTEL